MMKQNQTALTASAGLGLKKKIGLAVGVALLGLSQQALAHVEYYDLNAGFQIGDLTEAGKAASTAQYGSTPAVISTLNPSIVSTVDLPLNDPTKWNSTYINTLANGTFSGVTYTPTSSTATVDVNDVTGLGWLNGSTANLGDSHKVDFFNFRLSQASTVTIDWAVNKGASYLNSAFSLYSGFLTLQSHDSASDELNPTDVDFVNIQNPLDTGLSNTADVQGIVGAFRDTVNNTSYIGQFNALGNWSQANSAGNWSAIQYLASANSKTANTGATAASVLETLTILLQPGNYTIAAAGAATGGAGNSTNAHGQLHFSAAAVPLPSAVWLFMSAMFGVLGIARRKQVA